MRYEVIVVTREHAATLAACLEAVVRLEPPPERVTVVDNASRDGSPKVASSFVSRFPLVLDALAANVGFAAAMNRALRRTEAPWVLALNPDCAPEPRYVARLLEAAEGVPRRVGAVTGRLLRAEDPTLRPVPVLDAAGMIVLPSGRHLDRGAGEPDDGRYRRRAWVFGGTAAATLYRYEALCDIAYPDGQVFAESFFAYREDAELAWRLQWRGWGTLYVPEAVAAHRRGFRPEAGRRGHPAINRASVRNRFLLRAHCADLGWHLACFPWWAIRDLLVISACLTVERSSLPGLAEAWKLRGDARRRRRWVLGRATEPSRRVRRWFRRGGWTEPVEAR